MTLPEGLNFWKPKAGTFLIDIVPYTAGDGNPHSDEGELYFERTFWNHPRIGADEKAYVCLAKSAGQKCPVCEERANMAKDPDADEETIKALIPKERQLWLVYVHREAEKGVQLWECSYHLFGKQLDSRIRNSDEDDGYDMFYFPDTEGMTLKVAFEEESFGKSTFLKAASIDFKVRKEDLPEEVSEHGFNLDEIVKIPDYETVRNVLLQLDGSDEEGEEEKDEPPKKRATKTTKKTTKKPAKKTTKKKEPEPEPEDESDEDIEWLREQGELGDEGEDDAQDALTDRGEAVGLDPNDFPTWSELAEAIIAEEAEEETPEDDDDEDEEWDDEEEEEPPKKSTAKKKKEPEPEEDEEWDDEEPDDDSDDDDDDDDDDWDDEEDEPEPPKKKRTAGKSSGTARTAKKKSTRRTRP